MNYFNFFSKLIILIFIFPFCLNAQVIYTDPAFPQQDQIVTVFFDASEGNEALAGFNGPVYAHTGVITSNSSSPSDWQHVQGEWGTADNDLLMTSMGDDLYSITYNINDFYGVPGGELVEKLAFVFRNTDGSIVGRDTDGSDIFTDVYPPGVALVTSFVSPAENSLLVSLNDEILVDAVASEMANLTLKDNGNIVSQSNGTSLNHTITASELGTHQVEFTAENGDISSTSTFQYIVTEGPVIESPPAGTELGINYVNDSQVVLALYAPNKTQVFVLGDFNDFELDEDYQMKRSPDGNTYWLGINGLTSGEKYAFQYLVDGSIKIPDPYSTTVLDPSNDGFIPASTYPDLHPYPSNANGIVSILQTNEPTYDWQVTDFESEPVEKLVVYELLLRDFLARHDYATLIDTLDYLDNLGINAIELLPVNEFEGNISWGYNPSFHMALDKYYGTKNDFKRFVDECHLRGIAVILDIVYNHAFSQSPLAQLYWDAGAFKPTNDNPWLNRDAKHPFNVGYDFNHESLATKTYVKRGLEYWLTEFKVDGYRFDLSKGFTQTNTGGNVGQWSQYDAGRIAILKEYSDFCWNINDQAFMIMEHFSNNSEETELANYGMLLWNNMVHQYNEATMGYGSDLSGTDYKSRNWSVPHLMSYMESHDEERLMFKNITYGNSSPSGEYDVTDQATALKRNEMATAFFYSIPGPKMLWQFGEVGYDFSINHCPNGSINESCRVDPKPIRWDYFEMENRRKLYDLTKSMIHLKTTYDVFNTNDYTYSLNSFNKRLNLNSPDLKVTVLGNFNMQVSAISPNFQEAGIWYDYFTGDSLIVTNVNQAIGMEAGEYRLYTNIRLNNPDLSTSLSDPFARSIDLNIFPNPVSDRLFISYNLDQNAKVGIHVFDLLGQQVKTIREETQGIGKQEIIWNNDLPNGAYFIKINIDNTVITKKFISSQ